LNSHGLYFGNFENTPTSSRLTRLSFFPTHQITSSKVSNVILARPDPKDPEDMTEEPIAECFITTFKEGGWVTEAVKLED